MNRFGAVPELSAAQKFALLVHGAAFVGLVDGGNGKRRLYVVRCSKHGLFLDSPHGYEERFDCPDCFVETKAAFDAACKKLEATV